MQSANQKQISLSLSLIFYKSTNTIYRLLFKKKQKK